MYGGAFCRVYNEFGWNVYPQMFAEQLLEWLRRRGARVASALDLGCGTGVLCETLRDGGIAAEGVDLSADMIALARQRAPELRFEVADMTRYRPGRRFDLVTCTGDALNHVFDLRDVERVFENAFFALNPGGYFAFDLLNAREVPDGEPFDLDFSETVRARFQTTRTGDEVHLNISVFEGGVLSVEEHIREKNHDVGAVLRLLRGAGFVTVQCGDQLLKDSGVHATTWFIIGQKPESQK